VNLRGTLIICKALYGLHTSGLCWHEHFADCLYDMGFTSSKAELDIWQCGKKYEYIAVYIDDLAITAEDPKRNVDILTEHYKFKLKGTGPITAYLGIDFFCDECGVLCMTPRKYIEKMCTTFELLFGHPPKKVVTLPILEE